MRTKSAHLLTAVLAISLPFILADCGHKKKNNLWWLALMGNGGPAVSPENAGEGNTPATQGPVVDPPAAPATPAAPPVAAGEDDPDLNCTHAPTNDRTPPSVIKTLPADGQTDADTDTIVTVYFKNPIQCSSVQQITRSSAPGAPITSITNLGAVQLYEQPGMVAGRSDTYYHRWGTHFREGDFILGEMECKCNRVRMKPLTPLLPDTDYWVILGKTILSENGLPFPGFYPDYWRRFPGGAQDPDIVMAEAQGNLVHFSTSASCPVISQTDDPAFDRTPLKLCSVSPRAVQGTSPWDPVVFTFNKPVDCAHFRDNGNNGATFHADPFKPGDGSVGLGLWQRPVIEGAPQFWTLRSSCTDREIRIDVTGEFRPSATSWHGAANVGDIPDAKRGSFFRKTIKLLQIGPPHNWVTDESDPFEFNGDTWIVREGTVQPGSGGTPPSNPPPSDPPTCSEDEVLVGNKCVPEGDSTPPGGDQSGEDGGPEVACPGRTMTVDVSKGKWYQSAIPAPGTRPNSIKAGVHTYWANQPLILQVRNNCQAGWYRLILTASNIDGPLPSFYEKFNVTVREGDTTRGGINIKASDSEYHRGAMLVHLGKGDTDLNLLWTNDAYKQGEYDANINLGEIAVRYTQRNGHREGGAHRDHERDGGSRSTLRLASRYCDAEGRWFWEGDSAYTYWQDQSLKFCFPRLKGGRYRVQVEAKNHSDGLPLPEGYGAFRLGLTSTHSEGVISIPASAEYTKGSAIMDLKDGDVITLTWQNDRYLEGAADANIQIRKIKLVRMDSGSALAAFTQGARLPAVLGGLVVVLGAALLAFYRLRLRFTR